MGIETVSIVNSHYKEPRGSYLKRWTYAQQTSYPNPSTAPVSAVPSTQPSPSFSSVAYHVPLMPKLKCFVGGLSQVASEIDLRDHFSQFGEAVQEVEIKMDKITGRSRGFGFVTILNCDSTRLFNNTHRVAGKTVDVAEVTETKLFIQNLRPSTVPETLIGHFSRFGSVVNCEVYPPVSSGPASASIVFESAEAAQNALSEMSHYIDGTRVEVRKAEPKRKGRFPEKTNCTASYGIYGGYGEFDPNNTTIPYVMQLTYGSLGIPSTYGTYPVPGYDLVPGIGTSNRYHPH
jgi:RNA recognition motif-containing protein